MTELLTILTAFGVSAPAGLNAYIPLLIVGVMARFTPLLKLNAPFDMLTNEWVLLVLAALVLVEALVDKVPGVDHINDVINTFIRPAAGAILFAASSNVFGDMHPALALILGLLSAGSVHTVKALARPVVTVSTAGIGNAIVSTVEDFLAVIATFIAIIAPILVLAFALLMAVVAIFVVQRRLAARQRLAKGPTATS